MKSIVRKALTTAALGCSMFTAAHADGTDQFAGLFNLTVNDFIVMIPHGAFPGVEPKLTFLSQLDIENGLKTGTENYSISANRSWKVRASATKFVLSPADAAANDPSVADEVEPQLIYALESKNGLPAGEVVTGGAGNWMPVTLPATGGIIVASSATGGINKTFDLTGRVIPFPALNMSGNYTSLVTIIASLD